jgi:hypothetical protein
MAVLAVLLLAGLALANPEQPLPPVIVTEIP